MDDFYELKKERMERELTVWDVYNNEAWKVDNELITDWKQSLNSLLVFAAIFAAVLAAFILESMKLLEQDNTDLLVTLISFGINNAGNTSNLPFTPPTFEPTPTAVSINCLLFASLGVTLAAALAGVVALQWVADYDAAITRGGSSPEDRAKRRQFRFSGVNKWRMPQIIEALPLLLHLSVVLFWAGVIQWIWSIHQTVGCVIVGGAALPVSFYVVTTFFATKFVSAPFRTPLSRAIYSISGMVARSIIAVLIYLFITLISTLPFAFANSSTGLLAVFISLILTLISSESIREWSEAHISKYRRHQWSAYGGLTFLATWIGGIGAIDGNYSSPVISAAIIITLWPGFNALKSFPVLRQLWQRLIIFRGIGERHMPRLAMYFARHAQLVWSIRTLVFACIIFLVFAFEFALLSDFDFNSYYSSSTLDFISAGIAYIPVLWTAWLLWPGYPNRRLPHIQVVKRLIERFVRFELRIARVREQKAPDLNPVLKEEALGWLANQLPVSADSHRRLFLLIAGVDSLPPGTKYPKSFFQAPWVSILESLGLVYMRKIFEGASEDNEYEVVGPLLRTISLPEIKEKISPGKSYQKDPSTATYWTQCCFEGTKITSFPGGMNMSFLLGRDVPAPSAGNTDELGMTIKLIKWRNSAGPKDVVLWTEIFSDSDHYSAQYLKQCIDHFAKVTRICRLQPDTISGLNVSWTMDQSMESRRDQVIDVLRAFNKCIDMDRNPEFHCDLVHIICRDLGQSGQHVWPRSATCPADIQKRLANIKDPLFAVIGTYVSGTTLPSMDSITTAYFEKYRESLSIVQSLLYTTLLSTDPPVIWHLRAAVWCEHTCQSMTTILDQALKFPEQLSYAELIFQNATQCHSHSSGPHHILFHLYSASIPGGHLQQEKMLFGKVRLKEESLNPILLLLVLSNIDELLLGDDISEECIKRVWEVCKSAKKQPASFILLLTDIAHQQAREPNVNLKETALLLSLIAEALSLDSGDSTTPFLHPLARALGALRGEVLKEERGTEEDRETVSLEAGRIHDLLHARVSKAFIFSPLQARLVPCAQASTSIQPAVGILEMYNGI